MRIRRVLKVLVFVAALLTIACAHAEDLAESVPEAAYRAQVSIIIDDFGYQLARGKSFAALPFDITLAIIPFTPHDTDISRIARMKDKEVMLHAPMETLTWSKWERGLSTTMNREELHERIHEMLARVPDAVGVNNHGGSKFTQDHNRMSWLISFLAERRLYFVDSRTIAESTAIDVAKHLDIPHGSRDIFLDNEKDVDIIRGQLSKLRSIALKQGSAIAIGHPYKQTLAALEKELPRFTQQGIRLIKVSDLINKKDKTSANVAILAAKARHKKSADIE